MKTILFRVLGLCVLVLLAGCKKERPFEMPPGYDKIDRRQLLQDELRHYPSIDPTGRWMVYAQNGTNGLEYRLMNLQTHSVTSIVAHARVNYEKSVSELYCWSTDGKWLAWIQPAKEGPEWVVKVRNMSSGKIEETGVKEKVNDFIWLDGHRIGICVANRMLIATRTGGGWKADRKRWLTLIPLPSKESQQTTTKAKSTKRPEIDAKTLTRFESNQLAYSVGGKLRAVDIQAGKARWLTDWQLGQLKWLDYSPKRRSFLFSVSKPPQADQFTLMKWQFSSETTNDPVALTAPDVSALKGRWLSNGCAFVEQKEGQSTLVVMGDDGSSRRLFAEGDVWSFNVGAKGKMLGVIGSEAMETMGLWQADPNSGQCTRLQSQNAYAPKIGKHSITNSTVKASYTVFSPGDPDKKSCPVLFILPLGRMWSELSSVLPRMGTIQVVPKLDTVKSGTPEGAEVLRAVRDDVARRLPVDSTRLYLEGISASTMGIKNVIETNPGVFRGLILDSPLPEGLPGVELLKREKLEVLVTVGTDDPRFDQVVNFVDECRQQGIPIWLIEIKGMGHEVGKTEQLRERMEALVGFMHRSASKQGPKP